MNRNRFLMGMLVLFAGCASQVVTPMPQAQFRVRAPEVFPGRADDVWNRKLQDLARGRSTKGSTRAVHEGTAEISRDGGVTWKRLYVGNSISDGVVVRTGLESSMDVYLDGNGPGIEVKNNSELKIVRLGMEDFKGKRLTTTMLELRKGQVHGSVNNLSAGSSYFIKTPGCVVSLRGGEYWLMEDGSLSLLDGTAVVFMDGKSIELRSHEKFVPERNVTERFYPPDTDRIKNWIRY